MSLRQKIGLLFIANNNQIDFSSGIVPGAVIVNSLNEKLNVSLNHHPLVVININELSKENHIQFPSNQTLRTAWDDVTVSEFLNSYLKTHIMIDGFLNDFIIDDITMGSMDLSSIISSYLVFRKEKSIEQIGLMQLPRFFKKYQKKIGVFQYENEFNGSNGFLEYNFSNNLTPYVGFTLEDVISQPILFYTENFEKDVDKFLSAVENQLIDYSLLDKKINWVLKLKNSKLQDQVQQSVLFPEKYASQIFEKSLCLVSNQKNILPLKKMNQKNIGLVDYRIGYRSDISNDLLFYKDRFQKFPDISPQLLSFHNDKSENHVIIICNNKDQLPILSLKCWKTRSIHPKIKFHLVLIDDDFESGIVSNDYSCFNSIVIGYQKTDILYRYAIQGIFGGIALSGKCLYKLNGISNRGRFYTTKKNRLKIGVSSEAGINPDSLEKIDSIINDAIQIGATPGAQVIIARKGCIVYRKAFGLKTFTENEPVLLSDLYDIASVTKIMATTPVVMNLYETGRLDINAPLKQYLPETDTTNKGNLKISEILRHKAGLPSVITTFYDFIDRGLVTGNLFSKKYSAKYPNKVANNLYLSKMAKLKSDAFKQSYDSVFNIEVARNLYMNKNYVDSVYSKILMSSVDTLKAYRYSDMGFYLLQHVIEKTMNKSIHNIVDSILFSPMDISTITYLPLQSFKSFQIVPTENDRVFRKQLLRGYVHDPGATIIGGVAGNAGLFSNADALVKMMQLYLNKGMYGDVKLFKPETIRLFTHQFDTDNRRGLGFDKPEPDTTRPSPVCPEASLNSYGHLGFTGTMVWADPDYDLVYVFLSNRVHPHVWNNKLTEGNFRTKILKVIYHSMIE
ncbi:MAG: serine hydrolase [Marinilabiliaceae bacterium]|nr:serine hydrolase [Marinilabiliaceae bacterium]